MSVQNPNINYICCLPLSSAASNPISSPDIWNITDPTFKIKHHINTVDDDRNSNQPNIQNDQTNNTHLGIENPFEFLGARPVEVRLGTTIDPFRNHTQRIEGVYEWLKILICVPIAIVRLVLFGLSLLVGFVATKFALQGSKDFVANV